MTDEATLGEIRALNWGEVEDGAFHAVLALAESDDLSHIVNSLIDIDRDLLPATLTARVKKTRPELLRRRVGTNGPILAREGNRKESKYPEATATPARPARVRQESYRGFAFALDRAIEREHARRDSDFPRADKLRDELAAQGVSLDDKQHLFTTSSGQQGSYSLPRGIGIHEVQCCCLDREEARRENDYASADSIRDQLTELGVNLDDKSHTFHMPDGQQGSYNLHVVQGATVATPAPVRDAFRPDTRTASVGGDFANIESICIDRERARRDGDFATADKLRTHLSSLGASVEDKTHTFTTSDGRRGSYDLRNVTQHHGNHNSHLPERSVQFQQPQFAQTHYAEAQFAQAQYGAYHGHAMHPPMQHFQPQLGQARYGQPAPPGARGPPAQRFGNPGISAHSYAAAAPSAARSPSGAGNSRFSGYLKVLMQAREREEMRRDRDYRGADRLRNDLKQMGVECEDAAHTFNMDGLRGSYDLRSEMGFQEIQYVALEREEARKDRDYAKSDALREWLSKQDVQIDDKSHTFTMHNGSSGSYDLSAWGDDQAKRRRIA